MLVDDI
jgi:fumarate hydratase, class II